MSFWLIQPLFETKQQNQPLRYRMIKITIQQACQVTCIPCYTLGSQHIPATLFFAAGHLSRSLSVAGILPLMLAYSALFASLFSTVCIYYSVLFVLFASLALFALFVPLFSTVCITIWFALFVSLFSTIHIPQCNGFLSLRRPDARWELQRIIAVVQVLSSLPRCCCCFRNCVRAELLLILQKKKTNQPKPRPLVNQVIMDFNAVVDLQYQYQFPSPPFAFREKVHESVSQLQLNHTASNHQ